MSGQEKEFWEGGEVGLGITNYFYMICATCIIVTITGVRVWGLGF